MFDIKSPAEYGMDLLADKIKEGMAAFALEYVTAIPIFLGVAIGVYALLNMISSKLAKFGVIGVFIYGGLVLIA